MNLMIAIHNESNMKFLLKKINTLGTKKSRLKRAFLVNAISLLFDQAIQKRNEPASLQDLKT